MTNPNPLWEFQRPKWVRGKMLVKWRQLFQDQSFLQPSCHWYFFWFLSGLPLCSLGIMKDAWDRLRQCIGSATSASNGGCNTLPILNQVYHFVCGNLLYFPSSSPTLPGGQMCNHVDPKAITFAILQQQQRTEVNTHFSYNTRKQYN